MRKYETLLINIEVFETQDVITSSVVGDDFQKDVFPEKVFFQ